MIYDVIVIGGGPGGYLAAERSAQGGLKTLLFEKRSLGGVCLNEGCIPSKALLNSAKTYEHALHADLYGVKCQGVSIDQKAVIARKRRVVKTLVSGVKAKMRAHGVTVVMEEATITGKSADHHAHIHRVDGRCGRTGESGQRVDHHQILSVVVTGDTFPENGIEPVGEG